jgi:uncharacterized RDD family membrane protein YckC
VEASAAQNAPVTQTCSHCGAILPAEVQICGFCDASLAPDGYSAGARSNRNSSNGLASDSHSSSAWQSELAKRLESYRVRRRKLAPNQSQTHLPFEDAYATGSALAVEVAPEAQSSPDDEFSFSLAIGRCSNKHAGEDSQLLIDVSVPLDSTEENRAPLPASLHLAHSGLCAMAPLEERRLAALIDGACLAFACGGFLALFGSLGGQFTLSKLSVAVYSAAFAIVYLQYFFLFTVFGGTTPGMMLRGLRVAALSGEDPSPRQLLLRAAGYVLSAGTFFLGFLWVLWDEDSLTWHDRMSHTYLTIAETFAEAESHGALHQH